VCKPWFQATLGEAGTKQLSVIDRLKQVLESGAFVSDDSHARATAKAKGIELSGTLGVLLACAGLGLVTLAEANRLLKKMIAHGYHSPIKDIGDL
jgi:predicted nucleic acid-binding protein